MRGYDTDVFSLFACAVGRSNLLGRQRDKRGRFLPGNKSGTKFKKGNQAASKYDPEYCDRMLAYFRSEEKYPQFEEFADSINVTGNTLNNWRSDHEEFNAVYERCLEIQRMKLNKFALLGVFNSSYAKFIAVNHHGMAERTEQKLSADDGVEVYVNVKAPN